MFKTIEQKTQNLLSLDSEILSQYNEAKNELKAHNFEKLEVKTQIHMLNKQLEN